VAATVERFHCVVKSIAGIVSVVFLTWALSLAMGTVDLNDIKKFLFGLTTVVGARFSSSPSRRSHTLLNDLSPHPFDCASRPQ
jgi:hypothetical protein